ncbi:hypothetical protein [Sanguibacter suarezii]|uniref:hypothetical protein n=1 Tax=Sanguibacter suarezii TaxID=60921 RepID=UPI000AA0B08F|nr:hypothetical protein [Sanguibacter suarezii]
MTGITEAVRAGVKGIYAGEAGVELLIRQGKAIRDGAPWITRSDDGTAAFVDVDKLLDAGGVWSGGGVSGRPDRMLPPGRPARGPFRCPQWH